MSDTPFRKTLSLKKKRPQNNQRQEPESRSFSLKNNKKHSSGANTQGTKAPSTTSHLSQNLEALSHKHPELAELQASREGILAQLKQLEQRVIFTASEPLQATCNELKRKDLEILCKINQCLLRI